MERSAKPQKKTCYYKLLGIPVRASQEQIRRAFRYWAMKWHPDRNPDDPHAAERFREVHAAYETLIDPAMRGKYDRIHGYRKARKKSSNSKSSSSWTNLHNEGGEAASFDEIFQDVFGMGRPQVRTQHGCDLRFDVQIPKSSLLNGGFHEEISYGRIVFCRNCSGNGAKAGCYLCGGNGEYEETCTVRIWIPPGIEDGMRIRVTGGGDCRSPAIPPGDLILLVHVIDCR